jgi:hypothetical protein
LNNPNLVIETFHETEGDLVIRLAITDDAFNLDLARKPGKLYNVFNVVLVFIPKP